MDVDAYEALQSGSVILLTTTIGGIILLFYLVWWRKNTSTTEEDHTNGSIGKTKPPNKKHARVHAKPAKKTTTVFNHPHLHTTLKGHVGPVMDLDVSLNGKYLATCSDDRSIRLWSIKEFGSGNKSALYNVGYDHAYRIRFSPDSRALLAGLSRANTIRVYKLAKKEDGTSTTFTPLEKDFPKDSKQELINVGIGMNASGGSFVMTAYDDTTVIVRDLKGNVLHTLNTNQGNNLYAAVSPCGRFVASSGWTPDVKVWSVVYDRSGTYQRVDRAFELKGHSSSVWCFDFNNDSTRMITISKDGSWRLFDTHIEYEKGQEPYLLHSGKIEVGNLSPTDHPCLIALSLDAKVAAVSCFNSLAVFSTTTGEKELEVNDVHTTAITSLRFDIAGRYVLTAGDRHIRVFSNTLGYKETIRDLQEKVKKPNLSSATVDRLKKQINDAKKALAEIEKRKDKNKT